MAPVSVPQSDSAAATASAVAWVSWKPSGPVQALAPPELRITARSRPVVSTCCVHSTGAALTLLRVNTPAAPWSGPSLNTSARSSAPDALMPAAIPVARKPAGAVTPWVRTSRVGECRSDRSRRHSHDRQSFGFRPAQREVHRLHGRAAGALDEVVDGGDRDERRRRPRRRRPRVARRCCRSPRRSSAAGPRAAGARKARRRRPFRRRRAVATAARVVRAVQVARMPRDVGISTGVNDTVTSLSVTARRPCAISGVCRCLPPML